MTSVKDPKGNPLKCVLLQVMDADAQGPVSLRVRRDHETINLDDERQRTFLMVWVPEDEILGEMRLSDLYDDMDKLKENVAVRAQASADMNAQIKMIQHAHEALELENKTKTEALRVLQKERNPVRFDAMVKEAVEARTVELQGDLAKSRSETIQLKRDVEELKVAKRRLKEANERLKK